MKSLLKERVKDARPEDGELVLGCSKCRYSRNGCARCRQAVFTGRRGGAPSGGAASAPNPVPAQRRKPSRKRRRLDPDLEEPVTATYNGLKHEHEGERRAGQRHESHCKGNTQPGTGRRSTPAQVPTAPAGLSPPGGEHGSCRPASLLSSQPKYPVNDATSPSCLPSVGPSKQLAGESAGLRDAPCTAAVHVTANDSAQQPSTREAFTSQASGLSAAQTAVQTTISTFHGDAADPSIPGPAQQRAGNFLDMLLQNVQRRREERQGCGSHSSSAESAGSESFRKFLTGTKAAAVRRRDSQCQPRLLVVGDPRVAVWEPPQSPFGLIEEELYDDPWRLLLACLLLNKTSGRQVRRVIWRLFELMPTPEAAIKADVNAIQEIILPLGLANKRAPMLQRFSKEYLEDTWRDPKQLHGVGQYAADAYFMFCRGEWRKVTPTDKDLLRYHKWLAATDGQGMGLMRDCCTSCPSAGVVLASVATPPRRPSLLEVPVRAELPSPSYAGTPGSSLLMSTPSPIYMGLDGAQ